MTAQIYGLFLNFLLFPWSRSICCFSSALAVYNLHHSILSLFVSVSVPIQCTVQVKLELGHRAQLRKKVTSEGFTHDWMVFVRGPETGDIQHFVEKVVFRLHDSFPKPKRGEKESNTFRLKHKKSYCSKVKMLIFILDKEKCKTKAQSDRTDFPYKLKLKI